MNNLSKFSENQELGLQYYINTSISITTVTPDIKQWMSDTSYLDLD